MDWRNSFDTVHLTSSSQEKFLEEVMITSFHLKCRTVNISPHLSCLLQYSKRLQSDIMAAKIKMMLRERKYRRVCIKGNTEGGKICLFLYAIGYVTHVLVHIGMDFWSHL